MPVACLAEQLAKKAFLIVRPVAFLQAKSGLAHPGAKQSKKPLSKLGTAASAGPRTKDTPGPSAKEFLESLPEVEILLKCFVAQLISVHRVSARACCSYAA